MLDPVLKCWEAGVTEKTRPSLVFESSTLLFLELLIYHFH